MAATSSDKALLAAATLLVLGSAGVFGWLGYQRMMSPDLPPPRVELASAPYEPVATEAPAVKVETWTAPTAQGRGREWIYDTFTPPEIFYNARSKQFTVKPPSSLMDEEIEVFGLDLLEVRPEPFRLQLTGFVGGAGEWKGMFQNVHSGEVILGRSGTRVPQLGLTIKSLEVQSQAISLPDSMATNQLVAQAVIQDEKSGREVRLSHRERMFTGTVFAFVAAEGETTAREVRTGDVIKLGEASYRIDKIETSPPSVEVTKQSPTLTQPEKKTLKPREPEIADPSAEPGGAGSS